MPNLDTRPISWVKPARKAFERFPGLAQEQVLQALNIAAEGRKSRIAKPLKGLGSGIFEIALPYKGDAFRLERAAQMKDEKLDLVRGSGNVWRDFNYPDADIRQAKDIIAACIIEALEDQKLSSQAAENKTGFPAADYSRILNANYGRLTLDRLIRMLYALDDTIEVRMDIHHRRKHKRQANAQVSI